MKRSNEPVFWLLFAAGGMVAALLLPALVLLLAFALPLDWLPEGALSFGQLSGWLTSAAARGLALVVVALLFWHAMHRIVHSAHDFGVRDERGRIRSYGYSLALLATLATAWALARL